MRSQIMGWFIARTNNAGTQFRDTKFLCGVVEGFYGRPWTNEQRKNLFERMKIMGLNT
jgi:protein O-GlcNAcase/histone acetyltransferase